LTRYSEQDRDEIVSRWRASFGAYSGHDDYEIHIDFAQAEELLKWVRYAPSSRVIRLELPLRELRKLFGHS